MSRADKFRNGVARGSVIVPYKPKGPPPVSAVYLTVPGLPKNEIFQGDIIFDTDVFGSGSLQVKP
jgi:hypothetical protein